MEEAYIEKIEDRYRLTPGFERVKIVVIGEAITCDSLPVTTVFLTDTSPSASPKGHSKGSATE